MNNKVVIITGASSGIGEALAEIYASKKSKVILASRDIQKLEEVKNKLIARGGVVSVIACDVSKESDCKSLIEQTIKLYGQIDILVNNAGISMRALFDDLELDVFRKVMDVNFWGTVYCTKYALPYIIKTAGSIVGISSIAGKVGLPGRTGYSASKFAMEGFLESLRVETLKKNVHVLVACPGFTATGIRKNALSAKGSPQSASPRDEGKMMNASQVSDYIYHAVANRKRDLILTGNGKLTVWMKKFFPSRLDKMVYEHMAKEKDSPFK